MRVLITGVTGFVGHYLAEHIADVAPEAEVWGLVSDAEPGEAPPTVTAVSGDLTDFPSLIAAVENAQPEIVFHLAASSSVSSSWERPGRVLEVNAVGTVNFLEALRMLEEAPRVVVSSSAEIYGPVPADRQPILEDFPLRPISPYAVSKLATEQYAIAWQHSYGLRTLAFRFFNVFGPRQAPGHAYAAVIPAFTHAGLTGEPLTVQQRLRLDFSNGRPEDFERVRVEYHRALQEEFFTRWEIEGTMIHRVGPGDSLWVLSKRRFDVPIWLLRQYNPDVDLNALSAGTRLTIPTLRQRNQESKVHRSAAS